MARIHGRNMQEWCITNIYFFLNNQQDALIIPILLCYKSLHVSGIFSAHHQGFSTVHLAPVSFMQVFDERFQAESGWNAVSKNGPRPILNTTFQFLIQMSFPFKIDYEPMGTIRVIPDELNNNYPWNTLYNGIQCVLLHYVVMNFTLFQDSMKSYCSRDNRWYKERNNYRRV